MSRRIFLADDSVTIQKVIELTFSDGDYEVQSVSNGDEALAALPSAQPDFIILDVHMPGANGYEVCRRAKQANPSIPVLLLVGTFEPFDEGHARSCGADSFLKKPFDSQELLERVEELLAANAGSAAAPVAAPAPAAEAPPPFSFEPPAPIAPPAAQTLHQPLPAFAPEPAWGGFDLTAEPLSPPPAAAPSAPAYDREPSFVLEPDPGYVAPAEPVFAFEDTEPSFSLQPEDAPAPAAPLYQDRFLEDLPPAPPAWGAAPPAAELPEPELELPEAELELPEEPLLPAWSAPEPVPSAWSAPEPAAPAPSFFAPEPAPSVPAPAPPPAAPPFAPPPAAAAPAVAAEAPLTHANGRLSDEEVERIAMRVVSLLGDKAVREIAWEVVPDLAEVIIRDRLRDLEGQVETL